MTTPSLCGAIERLTATHFGCGHAYNNRQFNQWRCTLPENHEGYWHEDSIAGAKWQDYEQLTREYEDLVKARDGS